MKIASFLTMTTILIAQGRKEGRQHKNGCHCEEERRGNLPYFYTRLTDCTQTKTTTVQQFLRVSVSL